MYMIQDLLECYHFIVKLMGGKSLKKQSKGKKKYFQTFFLLTLFICKNVRKCYVVCFDKKSSRGE